MTDISQKFDSTSDAVTVALTSLAHTGGADSSAIDNNSDLFIDCDVEIKTRGLSGSGGLLHVYLLASIDNSDFTDSENAKLVGVVQMNGTTAVKKTLRIYDLPKYYKFRFVNQSGAALSATGGDHVVTLLGVKQQAV